MLRRTRSLPLLLCAAALVGACSDAAISPSGVEAPVEAARHAASRGARGGDTLAEFGCFMTTADPTRPGWWRYEQGALTFPTSARAKNGARLLYSYRRRAEDGTPVRVANCTIPRTGRAVAMMNRWLKVSPNARRHDEGGAGEVVLMSDPECQWTTDGACAFNPIVAIAEPHEDQPSTGGAGATPVYSGPSPVGPGGGTPGSYTPTPCTNCTYGAATVSCTAVTREATTTCRVAATTLTGTTARDWKFFPTGAQPVDSIRGPLSGLTWSGKAVVGGEVRVTVTDAQGTRVMTAPLTVTPRNWRWSAADWQFTQGAAPTTCSMNVPGVGSTMLGWNRHRHTCDAGRVLPSPTAQQDSGYTVASITGGPNSGLWYVTSARYRMDRGSNLNPNLRGGGPLLPLSDPAQVAACQNAMGTAAPSPMVVTWYDFNHRCMGINMPALVSAAWQHEGFGTTGGNGHESLGRSLASQTTYDPRYKLEELVAANESALRTDARYTIGDLDTRLTTAASNHSVVTGNHVTVQVWLYDAATQSFVPSAPLSI